MPDLTHSAITQWFADQNSPVLPLGGLDAEHSTEPLVIRFGAVLDGALDADAAATEACLGEQTMLGHLRPIMVGIAPARRMRLLHWLVTSGFQDARALLEGLTADGAGGPGLRPWLQEVWRLGLLDALFDPARVNMLLAACRNASRSEERT